LFVKNEDGWFDGKSLSPLFGELSKKQSVKVNGASIDLSPNEFVISKVSHLDDFKDYDGFENSPCNDYLTMREWLLAHAFPATTLPMGANSCGVPGVLENINMSASYDAQGKIKSDGLSSNLDYWPKKRIEDEFVDNSGNIVTNAKVWYHSDYKDLPYQFTYEFYKKVVSETK